MLTVTLMLGAAVALVSLIDKSDMEPKKDDPPPRLIERQEVRSSIVLAARIFFQ